MREIAKALMNHKLQTEVRRSMQHASGFLAEQALPESILLKLAELDRAVARAEAAKA